MQIITQVIGRHKKTKVDTVGDIVYIYVSAADMVDMAANVTGKTWTDFSSLSFNVTYDKTALKPCADGHITPTTITPKYTGAASGQVKPAADADGIISLKSVGVSSNTDDPTYEANGTTTLILNEGLSGFTVNGNFLSLCFEVIGLTGSGTVGLDYIDGDYFTDEKVVAPVTSGTTVEGIGASEPELADFTALNTQIDKYEALVLADYVDTSAATSAYNTAKAIDQTTVTSDQQTTVTNAATALQTALSNLKKKAKVEADPIDTALQSGVVNNKYTQGITGKIKNAKDQAISKFIMVLHTDDVSKAGDSDPFDFTADTTGIESDEVTFGLNVLNIPDGVNVSVVSITPVAK